MGLQFSSLITSFAIALICSFGNTDLPTNNLDSPKLESRLIMTTDTTCRMRDSLALVALYNSTDGLNWTIKWDLNQSINTWWGVSLNSEGCVICLDLDGEDNCAITNPTGNYLGNNLNGILPPDLGNIKGLELLSIKENKLIGGIPKEIGKLVNLINLNISSNQYRGIIGGAIPVELGNLINLKRLYLVNNSLTGVIPKEIGNLSNLIYLNFQHNLLMGSIPGALGNLGNLLTLNLNNNLLNGNIPPEISKLNKLYNLVLNLNHLSNTIPKEIGNLNNLGYLYLENNNLTGEIPIELGNLSKLALLNLSNNKLTGEIPIELGILPKLTSLNLSNNKLTGNIPTNLYSLVNLYYLSLANNSLSGCFSDSLALICYLTRDTIFSYCKDLLGCQYDFRGNSQLPWQGDFEKFCNGEEQLGAPCDDGDPLTTDDVIQEDCNCNGTLIPCDRNTDSLELVKFYNAMDGPNWTNKWDLNEPVDTWFGIQLNENGCVKCIDLDGVFDCSQAIWGGIVGNNLDGKIYDIQLPYLEVLSLGWNNISGLLPNFSGIPNLKILILSYTYNISGTIPDFSNLPNLELIHLDHSELSGNIPDFSNLGNLRRLGLAVSNLDGEIPDFSYLPNLEVLFIPENSLVGQIPDFSNLPNLKQLVLRYNNLSGSIPDFSNLPMLEYITLRSNQLTGNIPDFSNLPNLDQIDFRFNNLSGEIPDFTRLPNLRALDVTSNKLTGSIPNFLNLPKLTNLYFDYNLLDGTVPDLSKASLNINTLYLSNNDFTFEDFISNLSNNIDLINSNPQDHSRDTLVYAPQHEIYKDTTIFRTEGTSLLIDLQIDEGIESNLYRWLKDGSEYQIINGKNNLEFPSISASDEGIYTVEVTNPNAPDLTLYSYPIRIEVDVPCQNFDNVPLDQNLTINAGEQILINPLRNFGDPESVNFTLNSQATMGTISSPEISPWLMNYTAELDASGMESLQFTVCDSSCTTVCKSGTINIEIEFPCFDKTKYALPNVLFPTGPTGNNRYFVVETVNKCYEVFGESRMELHVFSRWGKQVYESNNYQNNWDGVDQSGNPLIPGTYYYSLDIHHQKGIEHLTGYIVLMRN